MALSSLLVWEVILGPKPLLPITMQENKTTRHLDLEAPITKVMNFLRKLDDSNIRLPSNIHQVSYGHL